RPLPSRVASAPRRPRVRAADVPVSAAAPAAATAPPAKVARMPQPQHPLRRPPPAPRAAVHTTVVAASTTTASPPRAGAAVAAPAPGVPAHLRPELSDRSLPDPRG